MIPGMNPRQMRQAMKRMGIQQEDLPATEVIIRLPDKDLVIKDPSVQKVNMMGQWTFQVSGDAQEIAHDSTPDISDEDIETVAEQAGVSKEEAKAAIDDANGDLAEAIIALDEKKQSD